MRKRRGRIKFINKLSRKDRANRYGIDKKWKLAVGAFLFLFIVGTVYYLTQNIHIKVNKISCNNQYGSCDRELTTLLQELSGSDLFLVKSKTTTLLDANVLVEKYLVSYKIPDRLEVNIIERKPIYSIANADGFLLVDGSGMILKQTSLSNLPTLAYDKRFAVGSVVDEDVAFLLELTKEVSSYYSVISSEYDGSVLRIHIENGPVIIFPSHGDKQLLVGSMNLILLELNSEHQDTRIDNSKRVKSIDLRYRNPVLKY